MTDIDVMRRLTAADPAPGELGREVDAALGDLMDEIIATSRLRPVEDGEVGSPTTPTARRRHAMIPAIAAGIVAIGVAGFAAGRAGAPDQAEVPEAPAAGERSTTATVTSTTVLPIPEHPVLDETPLTVLPDDRWVMTYLDAAGLVGDQNAGVPAEMRFLIAADATSGTAVFVDITDAAGNVTGGYADDGMSLDLAWYPYDRSEEWQGDPAEPIVVLDHEATVFRSDVGYVAVVPLESGSLEIRFDTSDRSEFDRTMAGLQVVDAATFDAALAPSVVRPSDREATINQMMVGVPRAPGVDLTAIIAVPTFQDRYQLGAAVARSHACAWFDRWFTGQATGDIEMASQAASALRTSRSWPVLLEMSESGFYPEALWQYVGGLDGATPVDGSVTRESVGSGLGCEWADAGGSSTVPFTAPPATT